MCHSKGCCNGKVLAILGMIDIYIAPDNVGAK